jgi:hypothetical protein
MSGADLKKKMKRLVWGRLLEMTIQYLIKMLAGQVVILCGYPLIKSRK